MKRAQTFSVVLLTTVALAVVAISISTMGVAARCFADGSVASVERADSTRDSVGRLVPHLVLNDPTGTPRSLADLRNKRAVVLVFLSTGCPVGNRYIPVLNELQQRYADQQVEIVGIYPHRSDTPERIAQHVAEFKIAFPVVADPDQAASDAVSAERTPEAFVLDARRTIRYRGRIDDRYGYDHQRASATREDLVAAIDAVLAGKPVEVALTRAEGCAITHRRQSQQRPLNYAEHVAGIVQEKCANCHRPGESAPFSLLSVDDVRDSAEMIRQVVLERRMPPWHADPRYGKFANDRSLSQEQVDTLVDWIDQGMQPGDASKQPAPPEFVEGWTIGKPDIVFETPTEVTVPASGVMPYQYFATPTNFEEDVWISAAEARPGNRSVVHHIICLYKDGSEKRPHDVEQQWICGTAPGDMAFILPEGVGRKIPAHSVIVWQMHYTPNGKEGVDRSQLGLKLYRGKEPPKHNVRTVNVETRRFAIPPGEKDHLVSSQRTLSQDAVLLGFMPHMHLRGKDFVYRAVFPDGRKETILSVPRYDFAWQSAYRLAQPLDLPAGTRIECDAHFDNSSENPANPDPTKTVRFGEQTWDEMMIGYVDLYYRDTPEKTAQTR